MEDFPHEVLNPLVKGSSREEIMGPDGLLKRIANPLWQGGCHLVLTS